MRFSKEIEKIAETARDEAQRTGHFSLCADHLTLAMLRYPECEGCRIMDGLGIDKGRLKQVLDTALFKSCELPWSLRDEIRVGDSAEGAFRLAMLEATKCGLDTIGSAELLAGICRHSESVTGAHLVSLGIDRAKLSAAVSGLHANSGTPAVLPDPELMAAELEQQIRLAIARTDITDKSLS